MEIKLWREDDRDREVAPGEIGELGVRGASLMLGYFDDQAATELSFNRDGWFMTGDLARLDAHGNLQIAGRKKDLIIRGGHNIYPVRIEDYTMRHAGVAKAAAFPVADERLGERVCLAVIPRTNEALAPMELLQASQRPGLVQVRHARILYRAGELSAHRERQGAQAPAGRDGRTEACSSRSPCAGRV